MMNPELRQVIEHARTHSSFYKNLYQGLPSLINSLQDLPIIKQEDFWRANTAQENGILTGPIHDGILFRSGGTTGPPKFSIFSKKEWEIFTQAFGRGIAAGILKKGDRVANLFYSGDLYGSFLFISDSLQRSPLGTLQLPIAGSTQMAEIHKIVESFGVNVLAGVPTTMLGLADFVEQSQKPLKIEKILFGGEALHADQRQRLCQVFQNVQIHSIGYASTDAGLLGYADVSCGPKEHRCFDDETHFEIIDEATELPILESYQEGKIVITNLTRLLMPMIRYPVGDRAVWVEPVGTKDRKFSLQGRSEEAARIGPVTLYLEDINKILETFRPQLGPVTFQLMIVHREMKDGLILRSVSAADKETLKGHVEPILQEIYRKRPLYLDLLQKDKLLPISLEWVERGQLEINARTGKLRHVIDQRFLH